jgi:hypothetical protein
VLGIVPPSLKKNAARTLYFEPGGVFFRHQRGLQIGESYPLLCPSSQTAFDNGCIWLAQIGGFAMTALARTISRLSGTDIDVELLKAVVAVSCVGLFVSLLLIIHGLDVL